MQLSFRPVFRPDAAAWLPRAASLVLFVALCALATHWVLTFSAMRTIPVPQAARVAQTEAIETGAVATLFGGSAQGGVRDVQLVGVVADVADGAGAAIVSLDGGPPKAVRAGTALSQQIRLVEIHGRSVVIERNGVRQEIALPVQAGAERSGPAPLATPPSGAAAPLATPMTPPAPAVSQPPAPSSPAPQPIQPASPAPPVNMQPQPQNVDPHQLQSAVAPHAPMAEPLVPKN
ncbi:general secretion pathway protein [Cupriavidus sp. WKF15]|uniref:type II secretion system protein N n=1 Tax=Cupriavidus sp. WKF15 TaxID=3032282 RepID=UPI0023E1DA8E|nr:type II secretion system protein N [Cupriavidus sp. WKF15]WER45806.1 general secretion pathway protein [Cupriavidus sp. WKF15]